MPRKVIYTSPSLSIILNAPQSIDVIGVDGFDEKVNALEEAEKDDGCRV